MFQLTFGNYTFQTKAHADLENLDFPDFAKAAFQFCQEWLSGGSTFTQHTSGSTGNPKEIQISRAQMIASAKATQAFFQMDEDAQLLCCLDPRYIAGKMMLVRAMVWNSPIELIEPKSNPLLGIKRIPDFAAMVPLQVEACMQDKPSLEKLKKIKHLIIGGAPISSRLKDQLIQNGIVAHQTYGMTETVSHVALAKIDSAELHYSVLPGIEFGLDSRGALWIKSASSEDEVIQTNDLVELVGENSFRWLGRADFVINSGGVKLHPELLETKAEHVIQRFYPNSSFFFFSQKDEILGEKLCLIIESKGGYKGVDNLLSALKDVLDTYEVPKNIFIVPGFLRTESGKINRLKTTESL
ncbi:AMP-binding protein [Algoriphagus resistens]|uniref:AMP-binding protein n=1 Tax=Algoriphagus resistens TaxID=1750590 RepID=UPI000A57E39B|nr:AMP-binding protein [Algoriphagus resistens]